MNEKALLESVYGKTKITSTQKNTLLETVESYANELAGKKVELIESQYADKFASMTESISNNMLDLVDSTIKSSADKLTKEPTIKYLMESVTKIKSILEDIGVKIEGSGLDNIGGKLSDADIKYKKSLETLKKAKELADKRKDKVNELRVELYIRKSLTGMESSIVENAIVKFKEMPIDEIEDELLLWLETGDFESPTAPAELHIEDSDIDIDSIDKDLDELDKLAETGMFESVSTGGKKSIKRADKTSALDKINTKSISIGQQIGDVTTTQLESLSKDVSMYGSKSGFSSDVDETVSLIAKFGNTFRL